MQPKVVLTALILCAGFMAGARAASEPELIQAAAAGDAERLVRLLRAGANLEARGNGERTALLAAVQSNQVAAARALIQAGASVNAKDAIGDSPYLLAGARGRTEILRLTLDAGADLKSTNRFGGTALTPACHYGHVETVRVLLATKVAIDQVNRLGWTFLLEAVILGDGGPAHVEIVNRVVAAGARVNLADAQGVTPLAHAQARGQARVVEILLRAGAR